MLFVGILLFINILANARFGGRSLYTYFDLTEEKRFTLTQGTQNLLAELDDVVYVNILLEGEFPAGFKRLQTSVREILDDFRAESGYVEFSFEDPNIGTKEEINDRRKTLADINVRPTTLNLGDADSREQRLIYPYAIFYYKGRQMPVNFLENEVPGVPTEVILNNSIGLLEYKFANAIQKLQLGVEKPVIFFTTGHGELEPAETADLERAIRPFYNTGRLYLDSVVSISEEVSALVVAKPRFSFSEKDKFKIDQYVMKGGKVLWLLDRMRADLDSLLGRREYLATTYSEDNLNLEDLLFKYGARIVPNLVLDVQCTKIELAVGQVGQAAQFDKFNYPYHPVVVPVSDHPVVKSLGPLNLLYPSTIDTTVRTKTPVEKTVLLQSSPYSRFQMQPIALNFEILRYPLDPTKFNKPAQPLAVLLEGTFTSMYENRVTQELLDGLQQLNETFRTESTPTKMIVVADGDVAKDPIVPGAKTYYPLGYNRFENYTFANKDFLVNAIEYLLDDKGVIEARAKDVRLRLLDTVKAQDERTYWQLFNIGIPLLFLTLFGIGYNWWRRRRFGKSKAS